MTSGVTPTFCESFAADRWRRCGRKSEPVGTSAYARFLPSWQQVGSSVGAGIEGLAAVLDQLAGVPLPASAVESLVLSPRVHGYSPAMLDELLASGEIVWSGGGSISASDGWMAFHPADTAPLTLRPPTPSSCPRPTGRSWTRSQAAGPSSSGNSRKTGIGEQELKAALWELIWAVWSPATPWPVRAMLGGGPGGRRRSTPAHRGSPSAPTPPESLHVAHAQSRASDPTVAGRWSALPMPEPDSTVRAHHQAELLLNRHGVLTKGAVAAEGVPGGFAMLYKVLTTFEKPADASAAISSSHWAEPNSRWHQRSTGCAATSMSMALSKTRAT